MVHWDLEKQKGWKTFQRAPTAASGVTANAMWESWTQSLALNHWDPKPAELLPSVCWKAITKFRTVQEITAEQDWATAICKILEVPIRYEITTRLEKYGQMKTICLALWKLKHLTNMVAFFLIFFFEGKIHRIKRIKVMNMTQKNASIVKVWQRWESGQSGSN